jgi:hypothetical protein
MISADMTSNDEGWFRIQLGSLDQRIILVPRSRHFGGQQWYFMCPVTGRLASVVWKPPGATKFASRHAWPNQVGHLSQFGSWIDRAHLGKAKIKARLLGDCDPDEWELPPPPRGMRRQTYDRLVNRYNDYQAQLDGGLAMLAKKHLDPKSATDFE